MSIPLQALAPKHVHENVYIINPESPNATAQGKILSESVVRIICNKTGELGGTGFLHKSSTIITAAHVISNCDYRYINVVFPDHTETGLLKMAYNTDIDIAVLYPEKSLDGRRVLTLSTANILTTGELITFWGFPDGVGGVTPILSTGHISGVETDPINQDKDGIKPLSTQLWILNANVNRGNSGSPVLRVADGTIIGLVVRRSLRSAGVGYAVPADAIRQFMKGLGLET